MMYSLNDKYQVEYLKDNKILLMSESDSCFIQNVLHAQIIKIISKKQHSKFEILKKVPNSNVEKAFEELLKRNIIIEENNLHENHLKKIDNKNVSIINYTSASHQDLKKILKNFNIDVVENSHLFIVIVNDYLDSRLERICKNLRELKKSWILIKPVGGCVWIGPIFNQKSYFDWNLLSTRIKENSHAKVDLLGFYSESLSLKKQTSVTTNVLISYSILANELLKLLYLEKSLIENCVLTFDCLSLETKIHKITSYNACLMTPQIYEKHIELASSAKLYSDESGERSCSPDITYDKIKVFNSEITGYIGQTYHLVQNNFHVFYGPRSLRFKDHNEIISPPRPPDIVVGKHKNRLHAEVGFIAEALERYVCTDLELHSKYLSSYQELNHPKIHPKNLLNYSNDQYLKRNEYNTTLSSYHWIPELFDETIQISWLLLNSLDYKSRCYFPASYCYFNYFNDKEVSFCPGDSNGCATGNSFEEAIFYAILEVIERDSFAIWWYNRINRPSVDLPTFSSPFIEEAVTQQLKKDRVLHVIDITSDIKIPSFVAVSWKQDGSRIIMGSASHLNAQIAIQRAILEHNQIYSRVDVQNSIDISSVLPCERDLVRWILNENVFSHYFLSRRDLPLKEHKNYINKSSDDFYLDIQTCNKEMQNSKLDIFWIPLTPYNFPLKTVKVIIPGMRHFWRRLGEGRLYQVPVLLGDLSKPLKENELNPISYFV